MKISKDIVETLNQKKINFFQIEAKDFKIVTLIESEAEWYKKNGSS